VWGKLLNLAFATITPNGKEIYIGLTSATIGSKNEIAIFNTTSKRISGNIPITSYEGPPAGIPALTPDGAYLYYPMLQNILVVDTATHANAGIPIPLFESPFVTVAPNGSFAYAGAVFGVPNNFGAVLTIAATKPKNARADSQTP
jgi:hypothetical protein